MKKGDLTKEKIFIAMARGRDFKGFLIDSFIAKLKSKYGNYTRFVNFDLRTTTDNLIGI